MAGLIGTSAGRGELNGELVMLSNKFDFAPESLAKFLEELVVQKANIEGFRKNASVMRVIVVEGMPASWECRNPPAPQAQSRAVPVGATEYWIG